MNYFSLLEVSTQEIETFFSARTYEIIVNSFGDWGISMIVKVIFALLIWKLGKKVISVILKFNKRALERSSLDIGVSKFITSILRVVLFGVLILMVVIRLAFRRHRCLQYSVQEL